MKKQKNRIQTKDQDKASVIKKKKQNLIKNWASQMALLVKNRPANAGDIRNTGLIPGSGRSPGGGHGNPFQYSCLENPMEEEPGGLQSIGSQSVRRD